MLGCDKKLHTQQSATAEQKIIGSLVTICSGVSKFVKLDVRDFDHLWPIQKNNDVTTWLTSLFPPLSFCCTVSQLNQALSNGKAAQSADKPKNWDSQD
jgi:hypothetical protein